MASNTKKYGQPYQGNRPHQGSVGSKHVQSQASASSTQQPVKEPVKGSTASIQQNYPSTNGFASIIGKIISFLLNLVMNIAGGIKGFVWSNRQYNNSPINEGILSGLLVGIYIHSLQIGQLSQFAYICMQIVAFVLARAAWSEKSLSRFVRYLVVSLAFIGWAEYQTQGLVAYFLGLGYNSIAFLLMPVVMLIVWGFFTVRSFISRGGRGKPEAIPAKEVAPRPNQPVTNNAPVQPSYNEAVTIIRKAGNAKLGDSMILKTIAEAVRANIDIPEMHESMILVEFAVLVRDNNFRAETLGKLIEQVLYSVVGDVKLKNTWDVVTTPVVKTEAPRPAPQPAKTEATTVTTSTPPQEAPEVKTVQKVVEEVKPDAPVVPAVTKPAEEPQEKVAQQLPKPFNWKQHEQVLWKMPDVNGAVNQMVKESPIREIWKDSETGEYAKPGTIYFKGIIPSFNEEGLLAASVEHAAELIIAFTKDATIAHSNEPFISRDAFMKFRSEWIADEVEAVNETLDAVPA